MGNFVYITYENIFYEVEVEFGFYQRSPLFKSRWSAIFLENGNLVF